MEAAWEGLMLALRLSPPSSSLLPLPAAPCEAAEAAAADTAATRAGEACGAALPLRALGRRPKLRLTDRCRECCGEESSSGAAAGE